MSEQAALIGAGLTALTPEQAGNLVRWLLNETASCPVPGFAPVWAVMQCHDTFVWGVRMGEQWVWASEADAARDGVPLRDRVEALRPPAVKTLLEVRAFGPEAEALVCRVGEAFAGRLLQDAQVGAEETDLKPLDRRAAFLPSKHHEADEVAPGRWEPNRAKKVEPLGTSGFVRRTMPDGRMTVTPPGEAVLLKEYLAEADDTGIVRIAATRFVEVK